MRFGVERDHRPRLSVFDRLPSLATWTRDVEYCVPGDGGQMRFGLLWDH
jgi:hypothetical protein